MGKEFEQIKWNDQLADDCRQIVRLAVREDLDRGQDWTTLAVIEHGEQGKAAIVARESGVIAGLPALQLALDEMEIDVRWQAFAQDGDTVSAAMTLVEIEAPVRDLLTAERLLLNMLGHMSGIASLTRKYVDAVSGAKARIYDTRKTTPAWRRLEKYAVRCGGGHNHRMGLYDAVLIKDNHLKLMALRSDGERHSPADAVEAARRFIGEMFLEDARADKFVVEVEVDTLEQLDDVLPVGPDIVLLDNMTPDQLQESVARRNSVNPDVELEASGGIDLESVQAVAKTGVDRISVGALTHSARSLDVALDWIE